ncbi:MAG: hypothetical protein J6V44_13125 [Methanobrevibacter sp.]|nr:hypothetical protein [Methanobrevibacter sp.]
MEDAWVIFKEDKVIGLAENKDSALFVLDKLILKNEPQFQDILYNSYVMSGHISSDEFGAGSYFAKYTEYID